MTITKDEALQTMRDAMKAILASGGAVPVPVLHIARDALAATSHIAPDAAAIRAEPVYQVNQQGSIWIDIPEGDYEYNRLEKGEKVRTLYTAPIAPAIAPEVDPVAHVMQAIKDAPANIAARMDAKPNGNMSVEFPAIAPEASELLSCDSPAAFAMSFAALAMQSNKPEARELSSIKTWQERVSLLVEGDAATKEWFASNMTSLGFREAMAEIADLRAAIAMHQSAAATDDRELRRKVSKALGLEDGGKFAWSYLISLMESATAFCDKVESEQAAAEPVPTGLTNSELDDMAFGYCPSGKIGELREFGRALEARLSATKPAASEAVGVEVIADVIEKLMEGSYIDWMRRGGDDEDFVSIEAERAFLCGLIRLAAPAAPTDAKPDSPIYFMRDNHTFRSLPDDVDQAVDAIGEEFDKGYTSGSVCTRRTGAAPSLNLRHTTPRNQQLVLAREWLTVEIAARDALKSSPQASRTEGGD